LPRAVSTVHDLVAFRYPETFPPGPRRLKQTLLRRTARLAAHIIVPSEATKRDLVEILAVDPERVTVVPHGVDPPPEAVGGPPHPRPYFLYLGTLEPRKNLVRLIQAYRTLKRAHADAPDLVLAGKPGWLYTPIYQEAARVDPPHAVVFLGYVENARVWAWYRHAVAFCFPTLYEGFGLPVLEAMAAGCPVITADRGAVREVADGVGILVDPEDVGAIAEALRAAWLERSRLQDQVAAGVARARAWTWTRTAELTRAVYQRVAP
jgi:glycosyltransferase involved in cell wall biosynthesis